ncbi:O-antigen ligase family protein [Georgenia sp. 10Sc9-8]|uniref:O-antigen ligase family protein n=1 Tax=Georgenia halotolerans TaxID=3028317 RepID=A0ABT5TXL3_9MICO|nr:O-antigen ligase family protein [Georgenia halotolerans]
MLEGLSDVALTALIPAAVLTWMGVLALVLWHRMAQRGGPWEFQALLIVTGPLIMVGIFFYPDEGTAGGIVPRLVAALSSLSVALSILLALRSVGAPRRFVGGMVAAVAAYFLALVVSAMVARSSGIPTEYLTTPILLLAVLVSGAYTRDEAIDVSRWSLRTIIALSLAAAVLLPSTAFNTSEARTIFGLNRLEGITSHPNTLGALAVLAFLLELRSRSIVWMGAALTALVLAQSNTAWAALLVGVLCLVRASALRIGVYGALIGGAGALLLSPAVAKSVMVLLTDERATTLNGRTTIWQAALAGFKDNALFGYGPGLLDDAYRARYLPQFDAAAQAHNQFVQSMAGAGILGAATLIALVSVLVRYSWKARQTDGGLSLALTAILVMRSLTETPLRPVGPGTSTFFLLVTFAIVAATHSEWASQHERALPVRPLVSRTERLALTRKSR